MMAKRSYYKEVQAVLKIYKAEGYTSVNLNSSREVLDEVLRGIVKLHPSLDWSTVFFFPETTLSILQSVDIKEVQEQGTKTSTKKIRPSEAAKKVKRALTKAFPGVEFWVKSDPKAHPRNQKKNLLIGWCNSENAEATVDAIIEVALTYYSYIVPIHNTTY